MENISPKNNKATTILAQIGSGRGRDGGSDSYLFPIFSIVLVILVSKIIKNMHELQLEIRCYSKYAVYICLLMCKTPV